MLIALEFITDNSDPKVPNNLPPLPSRQPLNMVNFVLSRVRVKGLQNVRSYLRKALYHRLAGPMPLSGNPRNHLRCL